MALVDVEQHTAEWLQMRCGCVTASRVAEVMTKLKKKQAESAARRNYKSQIICEMLTGRAADNYVTREMEWGIENEVFARSAYEVAVGETERIGFALHDTIPRFGASPDGFAGEDGLVEFKCPTTAVHLDYIAAGIVPAEYHWQMLAQMACAERQWCDFVSFDPRLPKKLQLFVRRFERDNERIKHMEEEVIQFLSEAVAQIKAVEKSKFVDLNVAPLEDQLRRSLLGSGNPASERLTLATGSSAPGEEEEETLSNA